MLSKHSPNRKKTIMSNFWQSKTKIRRTDTLFSEYVRKRDKECQFKVKCYGHQDIKQLHCCHFFGRARESTRFDPENALAGCASCHLYVDSTAEGKQFFAELQLARLGEKRLGLLTLRANTPTKRDDKLMLLYVKDLLKEFEQVEQS